MVKYRQMTLKKPKALTPGGSRGIPIIICIDIGLVGSILLRFPRAEAGEQDDEHAQEEQDHGCQAGPHANGVESVGAAAVGVDMVFDDLGRG